MRKLLIVAVAFCLFFSQTCFAQVVAQLDVSRYRASQGQSLSSQDKFRPVHLRYLAYHPAQNKFQLLLDKGDGLNLGRPVLNEATKTLLGYFFVGVALPNDSFWVNLRPDSDKEIIDERLAKTDVGRILLEADVQLKKDAARFASPQTKEGKEYWNRLYKKATEIFGSSSVDIPTTTRPWIVPGEILIREAGESAFIYKATLNVLLEQDFLKNSNLYNFKDKRLKALNEYAAQLMRELILPKLVREVNASARYASLRQVYYSLVFAQWFKQKFTGNYGTYASLVDKGIVSGVTSKEPWSKDTYYQAYLKSVKEGEYKVTDQGSSAQAPRHYFGGGIDFRFSFQPAPIIRTEIPRIPRIPRIATIPIERVPTIPIPRVTFATIDTRTNSFPALIVESGEIGRVVTATANVLPSYISTGADFVGNLQMANLEAVEVKVEPISVTPALSFAEPTISVIPVAEIGRNLAIEQIKVQLQRNLGIISAKTDEQLLKLAEYVSEIQVKGAEIIEAEVPDMPGISKAEVVRVAREVISNAITPAPVISEAQFNEIQEDIKLLPIARVSVQVVPAVGPVKVVVNDISSKELSRVPGVMKVATTYNRDTGRLTMQAAQPVLIIRASNQENIIFSVPARVENVVVARIRLSDGKILEVVSPVEDAAAIPKLFTSIPVKGKVEYVRVLATPAVINEINTAELAQEIGVDVAKVEVVEKAGPIAVVVEKQGAIIRDMADYVEVKPLAEIAAVEPAPVERVTPLDLPAIQKSIANLGEAESAERIKTEIIKPLITADPIAFQKLSSALDKVSSGRIEVVAGKFVPVSQANEAQKIEYVKNQNLPNDQAQVLAATLKVPVEAVVVRAERTSVSLPVEVQNLGGVDLRSMVILTAQGISGAAKASLGLSKLNLDDEGRQIENMIRKGILPAAQRVKNYVETVCQNPEAKKEINKAFTYLSEIFKLEEEMALPTAPELAASLVLLEASGQ